MSKCAFSGFEQRGTNLKGFPSVTAAREPAPLQFLWCKSFTGLGASLRQQANNDLGRMPQPEQL